MSAHECDKHGPGTVTCYMNHGCRCERCRHAHTLHHKQWRWRIHSGVATSVHPSGPARRLQALSTLGWSRRQLADRAGIGSAHIGRLTHGVGALVFVTTAERVARAYAELWDKEPPGPASAIARARNHAARQGWAPPAAWDDGDGPHGIDNPDATPVGVRGEYEPKRDLLAEVDHLRFCGLSLHEISRRLDVTVGAIERAWLRDGRRDFYAAMGASSAA